MSKIGETKRNKEHKTQITPNKLAEQIHPFMVILYVVVYMWLFIWGFYMYSHLYDDICIFMYTFLNQRKS